MKPFRDQKFNGLKTGIVIPMPQEIKPLTSKKLRPGVLHQWHSDIYLIRSGVGQQAAQKAANVLVKQDIDLLISWGTCVSLIEGLQTGMLVLPGTIVDVKGNTFHSDPEIHSKLSSLWHQPVLQDVILAETQQLIADPDSKIAWHHSRGGIVADMESGVLASIASEHGKRFLAIRAISDTFDMLVPEIVIHGVNSQGEIIWPKFLKQLLVKYDQIPSLIHLARGLRKAQHTLAKVGKLLPEVISSV